MTENKNNTFGEIWSQLKKSKKVLMSLHPKPDGDSLGSCTSLKYVLEKRGINVSLFSKDELSENLAEMDLAKEVDFGKSFDDYNLEDYDTLIFIDFGTLDQYPEKISKKNFPKKIITINIDHHETNEYFAKLNYINENSPSCCSVLFDFFTKANIKFDNKLCRRLLLGICTDTNFGEFGDSADNFSKMAFLIKKGEIKFQEEFVNPIRNSNSWKLKKLWGILLINMEKERIGEKTIAYSIATKKEYEKHGLNPADIRLGIYCMQDIKDLDLIFTLAEIDGKIKGSFRSKKYDTSVYSSALGGGGHKLASSFVLDNIPINKALEKVLHMIREKGFVKA